VRKKPPNNRGNKVAVPLQPEKPKGYIEIAVYKDSTLTEMPVLYLKFLSLMAVN
jgi:hypothetical protein